MGSEIGQGVDSDDRILSDHLASLASLMGHHLLDVDGIKGGPRD